MTDYETLIADSVYQKLNQSVKGYVSCRVSNDILYIEVKNLNMIYRHMVPDIADKILYGLDTDIMVDEICKTYRKFIIKKFFQ